MENKELKKEVTGEISANATSTVVDSISINYDNPLAGYMQSGRINLLEGHTRVLAKNTGQNTLVVRIMKYESGQSIMKEWSVAPGASLDSGIISIAPNTYLLRLSRTSASYPTTGTGTLQSVQLYP